MKKSKLTLALSLVLTAGTLLGACSKPVEKTANTSTPKTEEKVFKVGMVTDIGGVNDKSFNQSAWEGLQEYGKENGLEKGKNGFDYMQSNSDADYSTNLNSLSRQGFDLVFGIGFLMHNSVEEISKQLPKVKYAIVDDEVKQPNVASIMFKEQEAAFLAGVTAALTTKTNKIGFIGGMEIPVIERFESGFLAGVKAANPKATVEVQYSGAFNKAEIGQAIASKMYSTGADVIFHASGSTGNGLFKEAVDRKAKDPSKEIWAIGVDRDQSDMGSDIVLTSAMKRVDVAVKDISTKAKNNEFPGGKTIVYGLSEDGVGLAPVNSKAPNKQAIDEAVKQWIEKIKSGEVKVPSTREELKTFNVK